MTKPLQASTFLVLAFAAVALSGCGGGPSFVMRNEFIGFTPEQRVEMENRVHNAYRIQEGDLLQVRFAYQKELNQDGVIVLADGAVNLIGVDRIVLAGRTMSEADSLVTLAYSREYRDPDLSIIMQETAGRRVYVLGQVRSPGLYRLPSGGTDVIGAVSMAAGFTDDAARDGTLIVRVTPEGYQVQEVDLDTFGSSQFGGIAALQLESYDVVYVPRTRAGDLAYFAKTILSSIGYATRVAYDLKVISDGTLGRY
ncbi:MAG: polysaccharide biosynthesis/export family protein [bacterium]|nr:polysaccharide biosynthesis/export family protein [bacterium]